jgi:membrane protease subunit (stomatin/prohibitin family)
LAIIDVVKWDGQSYGHQSDDQLLAWKFPSTELSTWTQLIVNESQEALLLRGGALDGPFGPGRHVLKTENLPVLRGLLNLPFGRSPFTAEVWYVNKAIPLDVHWGTSEPIRLQDPVYNIVIPVVAHGQYAVQIEHSRKFLIKLVGTMQEFNRDKLRAYFRGVILTIAKTAIAREIVARKVPILEIAANLTELSAAIEAELATRLEEFGLKLVNFFVSSIDVKEGDASIETLRMALAKRAEMSIVGYTYQQERSLNALEGVAGFTAAENGLAAPAAALPATFAGLGVGVGAGLPLGAALGQQIAGQMAPQVAPAPAAPAPAVAPPAAHCPACRAPRLDPDAKFCVGCGAGLAPVAAACRGCGATLAPGARFCAACGTGAVNNCTGCAAPLAAGARFCIACGTAAATAALP